MYEFVAKFRLYKETDDLFDWGVFEKPVDGLVQLLNRELNRRP